MSGTACSWATCGMCGRCSAASDRRDNDDHWMPDGCDICGISLSWLGKITIAGVGSFCSTDCASVGVHRHELAVSRKTRQHPREVA